MKEIANSTLLMVLIVIGLVYIVGLSLAFLKKAYKRCLELGISKEKLHDVNKSSAIFSVVPAISIVVGFFSVANTRPIIVFDILFSLLKTNVRTFLCLYIYF